MADGGCRTSDQPRRARGVHTCAVPTGDDGLQQRCSAHVLALNNVDGKGIAAVKQAGADIIPALTLSVVDTIEKAQHLPGDFMTLFLQGEMAGVQQVKLQIGKIAFIGVRPFLGYYYSLFNMM